MLRYVSFTVTSASQLCPLPRQYPDFSLPLTQSGTSSSLSSSLPPSLSSPNSKPPSNHPPESTVLFRGHSTISLVSQGQLLRSSFDRTGLSVLILQRRKQSFCPGTLNQEVINFNSWILPCLLHKLNWDSGYIQSIPNSPLPNPKTDFQFWTFVPEGSPGTHCT